MNAPTVEFYSSPEGMVPQEQQTRLTFQDGTTIDVIQQWDRRAGRMIYSVQGCGPGETNYNPALTGVLALAPTAQ